MPIYEYNCPSCGNQIEKIQSINAEAPSCPSCGHNPMERMISSTSFILKGGGWYKDGYAGGGSGASSSGSSGGSSSDSSD